MALLSCFEATARHRSFTRAADELFLTQSAVSRQVSALEDMLNAKLFVRQGKQVELTLTGEKYAQEVGLALERIRGATHQAYATMNRPTLRLALPPIFGSEWLLPRLYRFHAMRQDVLIHIHAHLSDDIPSFDTDLDACISEFDHPNPRLVSHQLVSSRVILVASPALLARQPLRTASDLYDHTLLQATYNKKGWNSFLLRNGLEVGRITVGFMFDYTAHLLQAVKAGIGIALASELYARSDLASGELVAVDIPGMVFDSKTFYLVHPPDDAASPAVTAFRDWLLHEPDALPAP